MNSGLINGLASQPLRKRSISITGKTILDQTNTLAGITNKTFVTPVLGAATATSINGIPISGDSGTSGIFMISNAGAISTSFSGGDIDTGNGGGTITTNGTGSIGLGEAAANTMTTFTGAASSTNKSIALPNASGTILLNDNTATITNKDIVATQLSGNVAVERIATALTTPGAIGGTTPSTGAFTTLSGTSALTLGVAGPTGTAGTVVLKNATNAYTTTIVPSVVTANRQLNLPLITGTDTVAVLGLVQTFTGNKTFSGTVSCGSTLAVTGATTLTGLLTLGGGTDLLATAALNTYNAYSSDISLGTSQPSINNASSPDWIRITVGGNPYYIPIWNAAPPL